MKGKLLAKRQVTLRALTLCLPWLCGYLAWCTLAAAQNVTVAASEASRTVIPEVQRPAETTPSPISSKSGQGLARTWLSVAGLFLAVALLGWGGWAARRWYPPGQSADRQLQVVERMALNPRQTLYLVKAGEKCFLVGTGPGQAPSLIGETELVIRPAAEGSAA